MILSSEHEKQKLRLKRFGMAILVYALSFLSVFVATYLQIGFLSLKTWMVITGLCLAGNLVFLILFTTGLNLKFPDPSLTKEQITFAALWGMVPLWAIPTARPMILMFYLPAFGFGMLRLNLKEYLSIAACTMCFYAILLWTEYYIERPSFHLGSELFLFSIYAILLIWLSFFGGFISKMRHALRRKNKAIEQSSQALEKEVLIRKQAEQEKDHLIKELEDALAEVKTLSGFLPICANCKNIRDDKGYWNRLETYLQDHTNANFSHGICPDCMEELYPNFMPGKAACGEHDTY